MLLVVGGTYSGKRKYVKERIHRYSWISAYDNHSLDTWIKQWQKDTELILEGFEKWIEEELDAGKDMDELLKTFQSFITLLMDEEKQRHSNVVLIMLEMGRGIVPMDKKNRDLRDIAGWVLQEAAKKADEVIYMWHGLAKQMK